MARAAVVAARRGKAGAVFWERAHWVAIAMIVVVAVRLHEFVPGADLLQPVLVVSVGGLLLLLFQARPGVARTVFGFAPTRVLLAYLGFAILTVPFALWPGLAFESVRSLLPAVPLFVGILFCRPSLPVVRWVQGGMVVAAGLYALYTRVWGVTTWDGRLEAGGMYDSNDMASMLAICVPLAAALVFRARGRLRWASAASVLLLVLLVVGSGSRGGALGLAAGATVYALGFRGSKRMLAVGLLAVAALGVWTADAGFRDRMRTLTDLENDYNVTAETGRQQVWARGVDYYLENPVMGVGIGNFPIREGEFWGDRNRTGKWSNAHNAYIQVFVEMGTAGGVLFLALLWMGIRSALRLWRGVRLPGGGEMHHPEYLAALATYATTAFFLSQAYFHPLFALLGIVFLAERTADAARHGSVARATRPVRPSRVSGQRGGLALVPSSAAAATPHAR